MTVLAIERRRFLLGAGASLLSGAPGALAASLNETEVLFASAYKNRTGNFGLALLDDQGAILATYPLPARGHGMAANAHVNWAIVFARRPGNFALAFDPGQRRQPILFQSPAGRHFYGHGVFSKDGRLLYATENDFEAGQGKIGIYDATGRFARIGEFDSFGVGPHEIVLSQDGKTLCVANGGIETHPDSGRMKLNLDTMRSNITFVCANSGTLIGKHELPEAWSRLSMRHMAFDLRNHLWLGGQYQGAANHQPPLIAKLEPGEDLKFVDLPEETLSGLRNYVGSVATSKDGSQVAFTSPRGGQLVVIDTRDGGVIKVKNIEHVCGLATKDAQFVASTATGMMNSAKHQVYWDNHLIRLGNHS